MTARASTGAPTPSRPLPGGSATSAWLDTLRPPPPTREGSAFFARARSNTAHIHSEGSVDGRLASGYTLHSTAPDVLAAPPSSGGASGPYRPPTGGSAGAPRWSASGSSPPRSADAMRATAPARSTPSSRPETPHALPRPHAHGGAAASRRPGEASPQQEQQESSQQRHGRAHAQMAHAFGRARSPDAQHTGTITVSSLMRDTLPEAAEEPEEELDFASPRRARVDKRASADDEEFQTL
jgi:hypothetical protein